MGRFPVTPLEHLPVSDVAEDDILFQWAGLRLARHKAQTKSGAGPGRETAGRIYLAYSSEKMYRNACSDDVLPIYKRQLFLPIFYMNDGVESSIVYLDKCAIPRWSEGALNREITGFFWREPKLRNLCSQLYRRDIRYLGDLIKMTEGDLLDYPGMDQNKLELVKERISSFGFTLGMRTPGWHRPSESFASILR